MMDLLLATSGGEAQSASGGYVDDVFSAYTYTGNGSTQTINNGIDLAGKGGLVWTKKRNSATQGDNVLVDTARGTSPTLISNSTAASANYGAISAFNSTGYGLNGDPYFNSSNETFVSWTFRKAPKFFDVVTYTGNGASNRTLSHQLNADVGMITVKATSATEGWWVFHRSATGDLVLNTTAAQTASKANIPSATTSTFTVNGSANTNGVQYVAYLFAHDPSADGIIQCGSFTDASPQVEVSLGWEPQYILTKCTSHGSNWMIKDVSRGMPTTALDGPLLYANSSEAEVSGGPAWPTATGFKHFNGAVGRTYVYLAIRRPNKPPTTGTQVYNAITYTGNGGTQTVTTPFNNLSLVISKALNSGAGSSSTQLTDRLRGLNNYLLADSTATEYNTTGAIYVDSSKITYTYGSGAFVNQNAVSYINHFFKRASGFFDVVCDTGTGAPHGITHGLSVAPEFIIRKSRSGETQWECWHSALSATEKLVLNSTAAKATDATAWSSTLPTSTQFTVGTGANVNNNAATYVTYLFATLTGISKVGSYTGNGTSQTINCGFSTGSRFILVKRTDATGDWYVWDSVRGIIAANDPHLSLNTTAAEVTTDDSVDPDASGFIVNQNTATNINVNGGSYIFLAIA